RLNTTANGVVQFSSTPTDTGISPSFQFFAYQASLGSNPKLDFFGDGQADLLLWFENGTSAWINGYHWGSGQYPIASWPSGVGPGNLVDFGDFNDDGCRDVLFAYELQLSACGGATGAALSLNGDTALASIGWDGGGKRAVLVKHATQPGVYELGVY